MFFNILQKWRFHLNEGRRIFTDFVFFHPQFFRDSQELFSILPIVFQKSKRHLRGLSKAGILPRFPTIFFGACCNSSMRFFRCRKYAQSWSFLLREKDLSVLRSLCFGRLSLLCRICILSPIEQGDFPESKSFFLRLSWADFY